MAGAFCCAVVAAVPSRGFLADAPMTPAQIAILVILCTLPLDFVILWAVSRYAVAHFFSPLAGRYPAREPAPGAFRKEFVGFRLHGIFNFGFCLHIDVDDRFVHISPAWLPRLAGACPSSVPREDVQRGTGKGADRLVSGTIGGISVSIAGWVFEKAEKGPQP